MPDARQMLVLIVATLICGCETASRGHELDSAPPISEGRVAELRERFEVLDSSGEDVELLDGRLRPAVGEARAAEVELPATARDAFTLRDARAGLSIDVSLDGANEAPATLEDGLVLYRRGFHGEADVLHRVSSGGTEDFVAFDVEPGVPELSYTLAFGDAVGGLHQVGGVIEVLDAKGDPRLRMVAPYVIDAGGERHAAQAVVEGCAVDQDPHLPWGRPVTPPGSNRCTVRVSWDAGLAYPALVDPTWTATAHMTASRAAQTLTTVANGQVVAAGFDQGGVYSDVYNPPTGTWGALYSGPQTQYATATLLSNGNILVAGGFAGGASAVCKIYQAATQTWATTGSLASARYGHTATLLADGSVLVVGGDAAGSAERYDPAAGTWSSAGAMNFPRRYHASALLPSGKVLVSGGSIAGFVTQDKTAEVFNPTFSAWTLTGSMTVPRVYHTANALPGGQILVAAGINTTIGSATTSAEVYSETTGTWTSTGSMATQRAAHFSAPLSGGRIIVGGGYVTYNGCYGPGDLNSAEIYDSSSGSWGPGGTLYPADTLSAAVLQDGSVLVAGGKNCNNALDLAYLFGSGLIGIGGSCSQDFNCGSNHCVEGVCCNTACSGACDTCVATGSVGTCSPVTVGSPGSPSCAPFVCNGAATCPSSCTGDADCVSGLSCHDGACTFPATPVSWQGGQYVGSSGGALEKLSACGGWNGGASSTQSVSGDGYVEVVATETNTNRLVGISGGNWTPDLSHVAFGLYLAANAHLYIYESGNYVGQYGVYATGDRLDVAAVGNTVVYRKNGTVLYTAPLAPPATWDAEAVFYDCGATLGGAVIAGAIVPTSESVVWKATSTMNVSGNGVAVNGTASCPAWGAGAASSTRQLVSGDGYVEFTTTETNTARMVGLGQAGTWDASLGGSAAYSQIDYAFYAAANGSLYLYEKGAFAASGGSYASGDVLRVAIENGDVVYRKNGALLYTSTSQRPAYPLELEVVAYDCAATVANAMIAGSFAQPVDWRGFFGTAVHSFGTLKKVGGSAGWNSGASSRQMLMNADSCAYGIARCSVQATATAYSARAFGLSRSGNPQDASFDFALYLRPDGGVDVQESGVDRGVIGYYQPGDTLAVGIVNGTVLYSRNGNNVYVSTVPPQYPLFARALMYDDGATLTNVAMSGAFDTNVTWTGQTGTTSDGPTLTKTDPSAAWNAQATATKSIASVEGYIELGVAETTSNRMAGLTSHESTFGYGDIDYSFFLAGDGGLHVYENGSYMGSFGSYAVGDRLRVAIENGAIVYRRNGTLLFTSPTAPTLPLSVDDALYTPNGTLADVTLAGRLQ